MDARGPRWIRRAALAATGWALAASAGAEGPAAPPLSGAQLYASLECAGCHETGEISGFEVIPLHTLGTRYDEAALVALLDAPPAGMPRFPLTEAERRRLARHLRERHP